MFGVPVLVAATVISHPPDPRTPDDLADGTGHYIWLHVVLLGLIPLLGLVIWRLLDDIDDPPATASRTLLIPAVAWYAAFDALVGIGSGLLAREALTIDPGLADGSIALAERWMQIPFPLSLVSAIGTALWAATVFLAGLAHLRAGSPRLVGWGLIVSAALFGWGHPRVTGVLAMAALLAAVATVEGVGRRAAPKP